MATVLRAAEFVADGHNLAGNNGRAASLASLPTELIIKILRLVPPSTILSCNRVCRSLHFACKSISLWSTVLDDWQREHPVLPKSDNSNGTNEDKVQELISMLITSEELSERWNTYGSEPQTVFRTRAHIDRITCMKIVSGRCGRYLVTGAVDGWIRIWNMSNPLPEAQGSNIPEQTSYNEESAELRSTAGEMPPSSSFGSNELSSLLTNTAANERRKRRKQVLLSEIDTGGDITCVDAELSQDEKRLVCVVGSYYSSAGCLVYVLDLDKRPAMLDQRASLNPREWFGTHCVSLRGDYITIGTYVGFIHVFKWTTGWRATMETGSRCSTASVKLLENSVISVTRAGSIEVFSLPSSAEETSELSDAPSPRMNPSASLLEDRHPDPSTIDLKEDTPIPPGRVIARQTPDESSRPLLSVTISEEPRPRPGCTSQRSKTADAKCGRIILQMIDSKTVLHYAFQRKKRPSSHPFPYEWPPRVIGRAALPNERITGGAIGALGKRAVLMSNLTGGVPPVSCIRALTRQPDDSGSVDAATIAMLPLRPIPDVGLPALPAPSSNIPNNDISSSFLRPTVPKTVCPAGPAPASPPRAVGLESAAVSPPTPPTQGTPDRRAPSTSSELPFGSAAFSSPSSSIGSSFGVPSRSDVLTEICIDEAAGLICIGTARGNCWIADYVRKPATATSAVATTKTTIKGLGMV
ncbi:hypothetical protein K437DRAFT_253076 [Tilletiaria anomala UBC 951]|uniref:F-box domain-containing protein n=1 Tax=Tilletiaria anomala (strain ATCC 24038 / CBS 436.72 / UBC 951) TaxID=1037660 RepID=A0A066WHW9_TILAU|nr:uncharacterized protein K437DRAFT_253076 [Tilletiaria anomala UBC 951]KDN53381.1 hypothetical protein K437DRAFT_253076 [Tilletiaria anomala UBC 951]